MQVVPLPRVKALDVSARDAEAFTRSLLKYNEEGGVITSPPAIGMDLIVLLPGHHPANFGTVTSVVQASNDPAKYQVQTKWTLFWCGNVHLEVYLIETTGNPRDLVSSW